MRFLIFMLATVVSVNFSIVLAQEYVPVDKFDPNRDAAQDIQNALTYAKAQNKTVLMEVGGEWCSWCKRLNKFMEDQKTIKEYLRAHYVLVRVNYSKENENKEILSKYPEIKGYPHFFILSAGGQLLHSQDTGVLEEGKGYSEEKIMNFLKKWAPTKD